MADARASSQRTTVLYWDGGFISTYLDFFVRFLPGLNAPPVHYRAIWRSVFFSLRQVILPHRLSNLHVGGTVIARGNNHRTESLLFRLRNAPRLVEKTLVCSDGLYPKLSWYSLFASHC